MEGSNDWVWLGMNAAIVGGLWLWARLAKRKKEKHS